MFQTDFGPDSLLLIINPEDKHFYHNVAYNSENLDYPNWRFIKRKMDVSIINMNYMYKIMKQNSVNINKSMTSNENPNYQVLF